MTSQDDLKADDCGSWKNNGVRAAVISVASGVVEKEAKSYKTKMNSTY